MFGSNPPFRSRRGLRVKASGSPPPWGLLLVRVWTMATRRRGGGDEDPWAEPGIGADPDASQHMPGASRNTGRVARMGEAFWRECGLVPLSIPRWSNRSKMNANLTFMLRSEDEETIEQSFRVFRAETEGLVLGPGDLSCWDVYFRKRGAYLRSARRAREGARPGERPRTAGDIRVDNERWNSRDPGDAPPPAAGIETE